MACPSGITCASLEGKFVMDKALTDNCDALFALQGISWVFRKIMSVATAELTFNRRIQNDIIHYDIVSVAPGLTIREHFPLHWGEEKHSDKIWGKCLRQTRMFSPENFTMQGPGPDEDKIFLAGKKLKDCKTNSRFLDNELIQVWVTTEQGWTAEMIWGFEEIDGKRYHTRRVVVRKGEKVERVRLVYDYLGPSI